MTADLHRTALTIAGSDPSGGAGIQADIKTFTSIGVYCGAIITAVTCQNTKGVKSFSALSPNLVKNQLETVLEDLNVSHIKIGMLGSPAIADAVSEVLSGYEGEIIFDPVITAGSGDALFRDEREDILQGVGSILRQATIITPNLGELAVISGRDCPEASSACDAAGELFAVFRRLRAVCLTGGHLEENPELVTDFLIKKQLRKSEATAQAGAPEVFTSSHPRVKSSNLHGTGCTFSSAFSAFHLLRDDDREAFTEASAFTARLIEKSARYRIGRGNGPLLHYLAPVQ